MAKSKTVVVTGLKELDKKLHELEAKVQKKVARAALRKAGKLVQADAKERLEKNETILTGRLKRGIRVRAQKRKRSSIGILISTTERKEDNDKYPFGGAQLEFGHGRVRAYPFLRPAVFENEDKITSFVVSDIEKAIDEMAVPLGRLFQ